MIFLNVLEKVKDLSSEKNNDVEVKVKFVNRSKRKVQIVWIDHKRRWEKKKVLKPGKCYTTKSYEGNCWVAHDEQDEDEGLFLNYGYFYSPWKTRKAIERVIITEGMCISSLREVTVNELNIHVFILYTIGVRGLVRTEAIGVQCHSLSRIVVFYFNLSFSAVFLPRFDRGQP